MGELGRYSPEVLGALEEDRIREECGLFGGVVPGEDITAVIIDGLGKLQHRGEQGAGIAFESTPGEDPQIIKNFGTVERAFGGTQLLGVRTERGIGHVLYTTTNRGDDEQAFFAVHPMFGGNQRVAVAQNGNFIDIDFAAENRGIDTSEMVSDTQVFAELLNTLVDELHGDVPEALRKLSPDLQGAYSLLMMDEHYTYGYRDPQGIRPLVLGHYENRGWFMASEDQALIANGVTPVRDVEPGELIMIDRNGQLHSEEIVPRHLIDQRSCSFEWVYFMASTAINEGVSVGQSRKRMGASLFHDEATDFSADLVVPVPETGRAAALGYANAARAAGRKDLWYDDGAITRGARGGRSFIQKEQGLRAAAFRRKLNADPTIIDGKSLVVVDDSVVRGTTTKGMVKMLRGAGATAIHLRIASPPFKHPCFNGMDVPDYENLLVIKYPEPEAMADHLEVNTVSFAGITALYDAIERPNGDGICDACLTGDYHTGTPVDFTVRRD